MRCWLLPPSTHAGIYGIIARLLRSQSFLIGLPCGCDDSSPRLLLRPCRYTFQHATVTPFSILPSAHFVGIFSRPVQVPTLLLSQGMSCISLCIVAIIIVGGKVTLIRKFGEFVYPDTRTPSRVTQPVTDIRVLLPGLSCHCLFLPYHTHWSSVHQFEM